MKKFFMVTIILFFMPIFSVQANSVLNDDTNNNIQRSKTIRDLFNEEKQIRSWYDVAQAETLQQKLKEEQERQNEIYHLGFSIILSVGLIAAFIAYQYNKSRQFIKKNSFMLWFLNFVNQKNVWILIFCVVSFVSCIFYVPYNLVRLDNPNFIYKTAHGTILKIPKDFQPQITKIDYQAMAFREFLILIGCCAGYSISTIIKKNNS